MADVPHFSRATGDSLMTPGAPLWRPYRKRPLLLHDPKGGGTGSAERGPGVAGAVFRTTLVVQESSFRRLNSSTISPSRRGRRGGEVQAETVRSRPRRCTAAPGGRRRTPRVSRIRRTAENDRSVSSATWRSESPAWYCSTTKVLNRRSSSGLGRDVAVPRNSGNGWSCGRGG